MVGRPDTSFTTPKSRQYTPREKPVPSAFEQASLAAKRLAYDAARSSRRSDFFCSISVNTREVKRSPKRFRVFSIRRMSITSLPMPMIMSDLCAVERRFRAQPVPPSALMRVDQRPGGEIGRYGNAQAENEAAEHHRQKHRSEDCPKLVCHLHRVGHEIVEGQIGGPVDEVVADMFADEQHPDLIVAEHHQRAHQRIAHERADRRGHEAAADQPADDRREQQVKSKHGVEAHEDAGGEAERYAVRAGADAPQPMPDVPERPLESRARPDHPK